MRKLVRRLATLVNLSAALVFPASAVTHGHAHHDFSHADANSAFALPDGVPQVHSPDVPLDHPHLLAGPIRPVRLMDFDGRDGPESVAITSIRRLEAPTVMPTSLDARAPPPRTTPSSSRPRSPPVA